MAVKLHRCRYTNPLINKLPMHSCGRVEKALEAQGIEYERVKVQTLPRDARTEVIALTGQHFVPVIEFEDGSAYRAESKVMADEIRAGRLFDHMGTGDPAAAPAGDASAGGGS